MGAKPPPFNLFFEGLFLESYGGLGLKEKKAIDRTVQFLVENPRHPSLKVHKARNLFRDPPLLRERLRKNFLIEAKVAGTREIKYWALGWGARAEILEPAVLRKEVLAEARAMARLYETGLVFNKTMADYEFGRSALRREKMGSYMHSTCL